MFHAPPESAASPFAGVGEVDARDDFYSWDDLHEPFTSDLRNPSIYDEADGADEGGAIGEGRSPVKELASKGQLEYKDEFEEPREFEFARPNPPGFNRFLDPAPWRQPRA